MIRLFIAINCNDETKNLLLSVQSDIKAQSLKGNFSRPENLHLTLVFLGETPEERIPAICAVVKEAGLQEAWFQETGHPPVAPFTLTFAQTGCFRHSGKELWWVGAKQTPSLDILKNHRERITGGLSTANIAYDSRPFKPHITLGREIRHDTPIVLRQQEITLPVNRVSLMKSERVNGVTVYTEIFGQDL